MSRPIKPREDKPKRDKLPPRVPTSIVKRPLDNPDLSYVREGSTILLKMKGKWRMVICRAEYEDNLLGNRVALKPIVGEPWGSWFESTKGGLVKLVNYTEEKDVGENVSVDHIKKDNAHYDSNISQQKLTAEDVLMLKKTIGGSEEMISKIAEGNERFEEKTKFSQQKYLEHKRRKYLKTFRVVRPTLATVIRFYNEKYDNASCIRVDTISQILTAANVHAYAKVLVVENFKGIVIAGCVERMGGYGDLINLYHGEAVADTLFNNSMNFSDFVKRTVVNFKLSMLSSLRNPSPDEAEDALDFCSTCHPFQRPTLREVRSLILSGVTSLLITVTYNPDPLFFHLIPLLKGGYPFVVYCPTLAPAVYLMLKLQKDRRVFNIKMVDNWYREYQVLHGRTHPKMQMSSTGGYLITGNRVYPSERPTPPSINKQNSESPGKKRRTSKNT